jgi:hypothetical protein
MSESNKPEENKSVRRLQPFMENMIRLHGEIERYLFAAEVVCKEDRNECKVGKECPFWESRWHAHCNLRYIREFVGNHRFEDRSKQCTYQTEKKKCLLKETQCGFAREDIQTNTIRCVITEADTDEPQDNKKSRD